MRAARVVTVLSVCASFAACMIVAPLDDVKPGGRDAGVAGDSSVTGDSSSKSCQSNADCAAQNDGEPYRCVMPQRQCVPLKSPECQLVYDGKDGKDYANPNAIFIGAFAAYGSKPGESADIQNYRLGLAELSGRTVGGLPGPNNASRPLVLVACDTADANPDRAQIVSRGLDHLVNEVHVPGLIAALQDDDLINDFPTYGYSTGTFFLSPFGANERLEKFIDRDLLWHMLGLPAQMAPGYAVLLRTLETRIHAAQSIPAIRVVLVSSDEAFTTELTQAVIDTLQFNNGDVTANRDNGYYKSFSLTRDSNVDDVLNEIANFHPHVVISVAGEVFTSKMIVPLETSLGVSEGTYFVLSPYNVGALQKSVVPLLNTTIQSPDTKANKRYFAVNAAGAEDPTLYNDYLRALKHAFPNALEGTENYYDAFYFLAYAIHAGNPLGTADGADVARGMKQLTDGTTEYSIGSADVSGIYSALLVPGTHIRLNGTLGPPDFAASGVRKSTPGILCFAQEVTGDAAPVIVVKPDMWRVLPNGTLQLSPNYTLSTVPCLDDTADHKPL